jgi:hypothetical protein
MLDPLITKVISVGMGLMFLVAAYHKLAEGPSFRVTILEYQLLPEFLVPPLSRLLPLSELLLGTSWLLAFYQQSITAIVSAILLGMYAFAIGINLMRGRHYIDCGCGFGGKNDSEQFLSGGLVMRNLVLVALALVTLLPVVDRMLGFGDYLTLAAALVATTLLFGASNQLILNRASINTWRKNSG